MRIARIIAVDYPHHVTQRGNNKQEVFLSNADYKQYLAFLKKYREDYKLSILCYCLMPNHVHFIAIPHNEFSLSRALLCTHTRYSQYLNKRKSRSGHLWQGRFYSCVLGNSHLIMAARYIEQNPVRAQLVKKPWDWEWSSANYNIGNEKHNLVVNKNLPEYIGYTPSMWKDALEVQEDKGTVEQIKKHTKTGLPLAEAKLIGELEKRLGKNLQAKPRGRPWHKNK